MTGQIYDHRPGYHEARIALIAQPLGEEEKTEALHQLEIEWRAEVNETATMVLALFRAGLRDDDAA